jgi:hypothetical protein
MCQLCDEADAYLAEIEARAKAREDEKRKQAPGSAGRGSRVATETPQTVKGDS